MSDGRPDVALHRRIMLDIEARIFSGEWSAGHRIPYEHELMQQYRCSRMTVSRAINDLVSRGLIERRRKSGSYVAQPHVQSAVMEIRDIRLEVASLGLPYHYRLLERSIREAIPPEPEKLGLGAGARVISVCALHLAGERPFCLERRLINAAAAPDAMDESFVDVSPGNWLVERIPWTSAEHHIRAAGADPETARLLDLRPGSPCLIVERRTWSGSTYVTLVHLVYPGDMHELVAEFSPSPR